MCKSEYHILNLSCDKNSTALAFFIKDNMPEIFKKSELIFYDTEKELPETYDYLNKIEIFLDKKITYLKKSKSFEHLKSLYSDLPTLYRHWCTIETKAIIIRKYLFELINKENGIIYLYIPTGADEIEKPVILCQNRFMYNVYPFIDYTMSNSDIDSILNNAGIGYPNYYGNRKPSGCYFCPYQNKISWVYLYENHLNLFYETMEYELDIDETNRKRLGWDYYMKLKDVIKPENIAKIKDDYAKSQTKKYERAFKIKEDSGLLYKIDFEEQGKFALCNV